MNQPYLDLSGKSVLITGGAGFIGSNLALSIQQQYPHCRVVVFDAFQSGHFENLDGFQGECVAGDITDRDDLERLQEDHFDVIFHQAAVTDTTQTDQQWMLRVNTNAFRSIVGLAEKMSARVVYASSAGTYGKSPVPHRVGNGEQPANIYGFSKWMMDRFALQAMRRVEVPIVGLRYFNVYGPRETHKGHAASMILQLARQLIEGESPRLFQWGEQSRDFVFIDDVVAANLRAAAARQSGIYNVGTGQSRQFNEVVEILASRLDIPSGEHSVHYFPNPWPFYQDHTQADIRSTQQELGYQPRFSLEQGIESYLPDIRRICQKEAAVEEPARNVA